MSEPSLLWGIQYTRGDGVVITEPSKDEATARADAKARKAVVVCTPVRWSEEKPESIIATEVKYVVQRQYEGDPAWYDRGLEPTPHRYLAFNRLAVYRRDRPDLVTRLARLETTVTLFPEED